jgi:starch phosphorylase
MVKTYVNDFYLPAIAEARTLTRDDFEKAKERALWTRQLRAAWDSVEIVSARAEIDGNERVGAAVPVEVIIRLGGLVPEDISVEVYYSQLNEDGKALGGRAIEMKLSQRRDDGVHIYRAVVPCEESGQHGLSVRVIPSRQRVPDPLRLGLIKWM